MRILLDTHVALWAVAKRGRVPKAAADLIADQDNKVVVSAVTIWEVAIKFALRRGRPDDMPISGEQALAHFEDAGYELLPVNPAHAAALDGLPPLHGDPFDRLLVAQALHEPLKLVTSNKRVAAYSNHFLLV